MRTWRGIVALALAAAACGGGAGADAARPDGTGAPDAAPSDAAPPDVAPPDGTAADAAPAAWCDSSYPLRRRLTARNNAAAPLEPGFQIDWLVDVEDLAAPAPAHASLHVFHATSAGCTELDRVIDDGAAAYESIWVALADAIAPSASDASYWLYYGNDASPPAPSDAAAIFDFHEPFTSGTAPDGDWLVQGTPAVASGGAQLGENDHILTAAAWGPGYAVDYALVIPTYAPSFWGGFQRDASDFLDAPPWMLWYTEANGTGAVLWPSILVDAAGAPWWGTMVAIDASPHLYNIDRFADRVVFRYENYPASAEEHALAAPFTDPLQFRFTNTGTTTLTVDMVRIRRTIFPLPSSTVGPAETQ